MSAKPFRVSLALVGLTIALALAGRVAAQAPDPLDQARRQNEIAVQKTEAQVNKALAEARKLEVTNPSRALKVLDGARSLLEDAAGMPAERRTELLRQLNTRTQGIQASLRRQHQASEETAAKEAERQRQRERDRPGESPKPSDLAKDRINRGKDQLGTAYDLRLKKAEGNLAAYRDVDRSAVPITGDMTFPKGWKELSERRLAKLQPQLTKAEKNLIQALNSTLSVDFDKSVFRDVIDYLQKKSGTTIVIDPAAMRDVGVEYDDPVTFQAPKVSFRTILKKILADKGLAYILRDGIIEVVTPQKARETMVTRAYPIDGFLLPGIAANPFSPVSRYQVQQIIDLITTSIEPSIWAVNGGNATISFNIATQSMVIRAPAEMHYSLGGALGR
jgi:hypothetical protein